MTKKASFEIIPFWFKYLKFLLILEKINTHKNLWTCIKMTDLAILLKSQVCVQWLQSPLALFLVSSAASRIFSRAKQWRSRVVCASVVAWKIVPYFPWTSCHTIMIKNVHFQTGHGWEIWWEIELISSNVTRQSPNIWPKTHGAQKLEDPSFFSS